jgi:molybdate transport system ATP-binding protein
VTGLRASITARHGDFVLDVDLAAEPGRITAILGPNGSGKSTLLNALAGLRPIDHGRIIIGEVVVDDGDTWVPPEQRRVGVVFQDFLLFPHLSVLDNVAFGPRSRGMTDPSRRAANWLDRLGVGDLADRRPASLSGGQAQRVAMARALAVEPELLLLDEPLAALDVATRLDVRRELRAHLSTFDGVTLMVTHDPLDAMVLADDIVVLEDGRITQLGSVDEVSRRPGSPYAAALMGANLLHGEAADGIVRTAGGGTVAIADHELSGDVVIVIRPEAISLHSRRPEGSPRNVWQVAVRELEPRIDRTLVHVSGPPDLVAAVTPAVVAELGIEPGAQLWASAKALDLDAYGRQAPGPSASSAPH